MNAAPPALTIAAPHACPIASVPAQPWRDAAGEPFARCAQLEADLVIETREGCFHRRADEVGVTCHTGAAERPERLRALFERSVWPLMLQARGAQVLHAATLERGGRLLALAGPSGAGKSTLAAASAAAGIAPRGDDALLTRSIGDLVMGQALPGPLRLRRDAAVVLGAPPAIAAATSPRPLTAIVLVDHSDAPAVEVRPAGAAEAIRGLLGQAYCFSAREPDERTALLDAYLELAARVPVHVLRRPRQFAALPATVAALARLLPEG